ncbi:hypothetical protein D043_3992B, partial [Vibrio parahaemolyticus EKP-021]
ASTR